MSNHGGNNIKLSGRNHELYKMTNNNIKYKTIKTMDYTILSVAGKTGLYKLVSRAKMNLIVEALDETHRRVPVFASDRVTSLSDIAMYTNDEDVPLMNILDSVLRKEDGKVCSLNYRKCSKEELHAYFAEVLPDYDRDRVHDSDIKKLLQWYNILVSNGVTNFVEEEKEDTEDTASAE